jgi:hypothetical protein
MKFSAKFCGRVVSRRHQLLPGIYTQGMVNNIHNWFSRSKLHVNTSSTESVWKYWSLFSIRGLKSEWVASCVSWFISLPRASNAVLEVLHQLSHVEALSDTNFMLKPGWCLLAPGPAPNLLPELHSSYKLPELHCMLWSLYWHLHCQQ